MFIPALYAGMTGENEIPTLQFLPVASFKRENLLTRSPFLGFVNEKDIYRTPMLNPTTSIATDRRVMCCRNDLRVSVGRPAKDKRSMYAPNGFSNKELNTNNKFARPFNNYKLLIPTNSQDASKKSMLGIP